MSQTNCTITAFERGKTQYSYVESHGVMLMRKNCWLPCLEYFDNYNSWKDYEDSLYTIFKNDFLKSYPLFKNVRVNVKHYPIKNGKEEAFFHITTQKSNNMYLKN